ncbi:MAG: U32 family peptidase C-terminal domain-containing protein [Alphaproteobacteria bacterium]
MSKINKKSELLLPAGSYSRLKTAFLYGADVVYAGTPDMSLRAKAKITLDEMKESIDFAHSIGKKIYLAVNLYTHNKDIDKLPVFADTLRKLKPDGIIIADAGVFRFMRNAIPEIPLHVSTQANVCSFETAMFWYDIGAKLCVLGREVSFAELKEIRERVTPDLKLETFIHGSMCMSYSGRCLLSNFLTERSSNQGNCAHCCRWNYKMYVRPREELIETGVIKEEASKLGIDINSDTMKLFDFYLEEAERQGEFMELCEDDKGAYIMNSKDLCLMPKLDKLLEIGIDSLKVEGRNKSEYYAGTTAHAYSQAINDYYKNPDKWDYKPYMEELNTLQNRGYTYGFFDGHLTHHAMDYETTRSNGNYRFTAQITDITADGFILDVKNSFATDDTLEFVSPSRLAPYNVKVHHIINMKNNEKLERATVATKLVLFPFENFDMKKEDVLKLFPIYTIIRKKYD